MTSLPYPIYGTILDSAGSAVTSRVSMRNDRTGEIVNITSNSLGQYVHDAGNFTSGYMDTDRVTIICGYGTESGESSILLTSQTHQINLTLSTIADSTDTTYCTIQDVLDELGDKTTSDISYERLRKIILRAESEIDERAGTKFTTTTATNEIYDFNQYTGYRSPDQLRGYSNDYLIGTRNDYWQTGYSDRIILNNKPVISITSLYRNNAGASASDSWEELHEQTGTGGDFLINKDFGMITFVDQAPAVGSRKIKVTYTYGYATVPKVVEKLCILLSVRDVLMSKGSGSQFDTVDSISLGGEVSISKGISNSISYFNWLVGEIDRLWEIIGEQSTESV